MKQRVMGLVIVALLITTVIGAMGWYQSVAANTNAIPGGTNDPLVTKSYVDNKLAELGGGGSGAGGTVALEVVNVPFGKKLLVDAGGELIVRSGKAVAYSKDGLGLSDMTDGVDIAPGKSVGNNHLILFPREGRGVQADPKQKNGLIVLIRGGYRME